MHTYMYTTWYGTGVMLLIQKDILYVVKGLAMYKTRTPAHTMPDTAVQLFTHTRHFAKEYPTVTLLDRWRISTVTSVENY